MTIILTDNEENIIAWSHTLWRTPGEYTNPVFRVVLVDIPDGYRPDSIVDYGPVGTHYFQTHEGAVACERTYEQAEVNFAPVESEAI